jgi:hypothetical protein
MYFGYFGYLYLWCISWLVFFIKKIMDMCVCVFF